MFTSLGASSVNVNLRLSFGSIGTTCCSLMFRITPTSLVAVSDSQNAPPNLYGQCIRFSLANWARHIVASMDLSEIPVLDLEMPVSRASCVVSDTTVHCSETSSDRDYLHFSSQIDSEQKPRGFSASYGCSCTRWDASWRVKGDSTLPRVEPVV
jgi:hypothetical protein